MSQVMNAFLQEYLKRHPELDKRAQANLPSTTAPAPDSPDPNVLREYANTLIRSLEGALGVSVKSLTDEMGPAEPYIDDLKDLSSLISFLMTKGVQVGGKYIVQAADPTTPANPGDPFSKPSFPADYAAFAPGYANPGEAPLTSRVYINKAALMGYLRSLQQQVASNPDLPQNRLLNLHLALLIIQANDQLKLNMSAEPPVAKTPDEEKPGATPADKSIPEGAQPVDYKTVGYKPGEEQPLSPQQSKALEAISFRMPLQANRIDFQLIKEWLLAYQQLPPDTATTPIVERALSSVNSLLTYGVPSIDLTAEPKVEMEGIYRRMQALPATHSLLTQPQAATLPQTFLTTASELLTDVGYLMGAFDRTYGSSLPKDRRDDFRRQVGDVGSFLPTQRQKIEQMLQYDLPQVQREIGTKVK